MNADSIHRVSVLGLGTMGHGIAQAFAMAGCDVGCYDPAEPARHSAAERIGKSLEKFREVGLVSSEQVAAVLSRVAVYERQEDALAGADFAIEAIIEELPAKQELFAAIEHHLSPHCILASNTSSFPITQIAAAIERPERAINTHWFNPPQLVPVVEVVPGERTSEDVTCTTIDLLHRVGKTPIRVRKELTGFLVNRIQIAMCREIVDLLERGVASAEDIDRAFQGTVGFRCAAMGPLQVYDFAGLDIIHNVYFNMVKGIRSDREVPEVIKNLVTEGHYGVKTGKGFFAYTPESIEQTQAERDRRFLELVKLFYSP